MSKRINKDQWYRAHKLCDYDGFDYNRLDYYSRCHRERRKRFVQSMLHPLHCMECGGSGKELVDSIDFGDDSVSIIQSIYDDCGWCNGIGLMTPHERGMWLTMKREEKREAAQGRLPL